MCKVDMMLTNGHNLSRTSFFHSKFCCVKTKSAWGFDGLGKGEAVTESGVILDNGMSHD